MILLLLLLIPVLSFAQPELATEYQTHHELKPMLKELPYNKDDYQEPLFFNTEQEAIDKQKEVGGIVRENKAIGGWNILFIPKERK